MLVRIFFALIFKNNVNLFGPIRQHFAQFYTKDLVKIVLNQRKFNFNTIYFVCKKQHAQVKIINGTKNVWINWHIFCFIYKNNKL